ncbi:MAG: peptide chain release factor N(5)-glutamine methyltransferase [Acidimicrobiales bacterium]|nr:peptide chain release factor N(5)-glutamine methyltransferase [Acidimicrobiales bacterium]
MPPDGLRASMVRRLSDAGFPAPEEEVDELAAGAPDAAALEERVRRRETGEPLAWIVGGQPFCGRHVRVHPGVFVPRPQTEELARRAALALGGAGGWVLDACTGSGAVAAHLRAEVPAARVVATDVSEAAVRCARANRVPVVQAELADPFPDRVFDVVTAVAPYVPTDALALLPADVRRFEPRPALDGGRDGLDVVRRLVSAAERVLRPGGRLFLEVGGDQAGLLTGRLAASGWVEVRTWSDEDGDLRGLSARRALEPRGPGRGGR